MIRYLVLALILSTLLVGILDFFDRAQKPLLIDQNLITKADLPKWGKPEIPLALDEICYKHGPVPLFNDRIA